MKEGYFQNKLLLLPKLGLSQGIAYYLGYLWPGEISNKMASHSKSWAANKDTVHFKKQFGKG